MCYLASEHNNQSMISIDLKYLPTLLCGADHVYLCRYLAIQLARSCPLLIPTRCHRSTIFTYGRCEHNSAKSMYRFGLVYVPGKLVQRSTRETRADDVCQAQIKKGKEGCDEILRPTAWVRPLTKRILAYHNRTHVSRGIASYSVFAAIS